MPSFLRRMLVALAVVAATSASVVAADEATQERFHHAVAIGDVATVRSMLDAEPGLSVSKDRFEFQPVHKLDLYFSEEILDLLLAAGADIDARNDEGITLLHIVTDPDAVELLVRRGADMEARDKFGRTPLLVQLYNVENGPDVLDALLAAGADPDATDDKGETAFSLAAGNDEYLDVLRKYGVAR